MAELSSQIRIMKENGMENSKIIDELKNKGHSSQEIYNALDSQGAPASNLEPPSPSQEMRNPEEMSIPSNNTPVESKSQQLPEFTQSQSAPAQIPQRQNIEEIEEIAEAIVSEKIQEFSSSFGDLNVWREQTNAEINAVKQEIMRIRNHLENLHTTTTGKVESYNKSITSMNVEIKALSRVMQKIMEPLTSNVKELSRIAEKFKKIKS